MRLKLHELSVAAALAISAGSAAAFTFQLDGGVSGSFDSTVSVGTGIRMSDPSSSLVVAGNSGGPAGTLALTSMLGDQGNLNYRKGDAFTTYLKGTHELLLKLPEDFRFMARATWLKDFSATNTSGDLGAATANLGTSLHDNLAPDARDDLNFKARLLDLWVSKSFSLGEEQARVRVGNQVVNWGESLFIPGGINSTNAMDLMRLAQPGTQLKEAVLPAPMVSLATGLAEGWSTEAYVQTRWNGNYFAPTGSYWSTADGLGKGHDTYGLAQGDPRKTGQWGAALRWHPEDTQLNVGMYALAYHDKGPNFSYNIHDQGTVGWTFAEDRRLFGVSANFPVGDWAVGTELSYRPRDAVALNSLSGCSSQNGDCWVDEQRYQWHLTGLLSLTPSNAQGFLDFIGAQTGTLLAETAVISYPHLKKFYGGDPISAGGWGWGTETDPAATSKAVGDKTSWGYSFDFSVVYDGSLIPGWQVVPELYYFQAVKGRTPNTAATFMQGAKSANLVITLVQNPASWQFGINYARFWGGSSVFDQPLRDRNMLGLYLSRNL